MVKNEFLAENPVTDREQDKKVGWIVRVNDIESPAEKYPRRQPECAKHRPSVFPKVTEETIALWWCRKTVDVHTFDVFVASKMRLVGRNHSDLNPGCNQ